MMKVLLWLELIIVKLKINTQNNIKTKTIETATRLLQLTFLEIKIIKGRRIKAIIKPAIIIEKIEHIFLKTKTNKLNI